MQHQEDAYKHIESCSLMGSNSRFHCILAGEDPVWRQMMIDGYTDCYDIAKSFPQSALNKNPIMKVFGRHMVFFKCTKKVEAHCCGMACANHMLETMYGPSDNFD